MRPELHKELTAKLKADYKFKDKGKWLQQGRCPACDKNEFFTSAEAPWVLKCGRENKCGREFHVKELYPEIFEDWSKRFPVTRENPNAAADAYLRDARGFDLQHIRGSYAQESYFDNALQLGTATVRFPLPGDGWWERLIDQPGRFDRKARFAYGKSYGGHWWRHPKHTIADLAAAESIWIVEGIFDAIALHSAGIVAVSVMSTNNYPEHALADLRRACADMDRVPPKLIWAFDVGTAGVKWTRRHVRTARKNGWICGAAQVRPDGEGEKHDWNDLAQLDKLLPEDIETYLWNGEVTIAKDARSKAMLIHRRHKYASFPFVFGHRQMWAKFDAAKINAALEQWAQTGEHQDLSMTDRANLAAEEAAEIVELANCAFQALYFQRDELSDKSEYYFQIEFPKGNKLLKGTFPPASLAAGAEFKKRLIAVAAGGIWTGTTYHLDRIMQGQLAGIKTVEAIPYTGYSREYGAWILGDLAVHNGRVYHANEEDYFDFSKMQIKLGARRRLLNITYDPKEFPTSWIATVWQAFGAKGLVVTAFWVATIFAEQIRTAEKSLPFLECSGIPGTGKSTLIEFLWRLMGREHEGDDPLKGTNVAFARKMAAVGNLPFVILESDRQQETSHAKKFDWDETKTFYNGGYTRSRGAANSGLDTYEAPFRSAIVIAQNAPVESTPAVMERIMAIHFDKAGWSRETKEAADKIGAYKIDDVSGFIVHVARREKELLEHYFAASKHYQRDFADDPQLHNNRVILNHAQLAAMLDMLRRICPQIPDYQAKVTHDFIRNMARVRQDVTSSDLATVITFWERYDWIASQQTGNAPNPINHSRNPKVIAINLTHYEQLLGEYRLSLPCSINDLKKHLHTSKARKFIRASTVNSVTNKHVHCWQFENPDHGATT